MRTQNVFDLPASTDILVVGAGVAGLYCAWRLLDLGKAKRVIVVERLDRYGGRLDTDLIRIKNTKGTAVIREEEGGMRFHYDMKELMALTGALDLCDQIVPFPAAPAEKNENRYLCRGRSFTVAEAVNDPKIWQQVYNLADNDRERGIDGKGKSPDTIITDVYKRIIAANPTQKWPDSPTPADWQRFRLDFQWKSKPMNDWQMWGLLRDMEYTQECITMLSVTLGLGAFLSLANAGETFQLLLDSPTASFYTFRHGYSTLPETLCRRIEKLGGEIYLGVDVMRLEAQEDRFVVALQEAAQDHSSLPRVKQGIAKYIEAPKVILAVAANALTQLYESSPVFRDGPRAKQIWSDLRSVVSLSLTKINLYFDEAWWEDEHVVSPTIGYGQSVTDLPIDALIPFYPVSGRGDADLPAALTIYCDFYNCNFWHGLQNVGPLFDSPLQRQHSLPPVTMFPASAALVGEALKQIGQVYQASEVPQPVLTSYRLWGGESDFGYAYHQWALNADDRGVMERMAEPVANIYTCNEAYSDDQGWVNGSLRSADRALRKFGINPLDPEQACQPPRSSS